jgi:hypothetical protein
MSSDKLTIQSDAEPALSGIHRAMTKLVSRLPGDLGRPTDLQRTLGVDYKLCWQVLNITWTQDPLLISQYVPGVNPTRRLLAAARALGVAEDVLENVDRTIKEFQSVVAKHSDDRRGFDSMIASISGGDAAELLSLQHRRDAFRSERQIWGNQVQTFFRQMIVRKSVNGNGIDKCFVNAKYGLRWLRQDVAPIMHGYRETSPGSIQENSVEPLDPVAAQTYGAPVLANFSTQPVPRFNTIQHSDGWIYSSLRADQIGRKSAVDLVFAGVTRNMEMERDESGSPALLCGAVTIAPTELGIVELLVHRPSFCDAVASFEVYAVGAGTEVPDAMRLRQRFPMSERVAALGSAETAEGVAEVPSYAAQLDYTFNQLGWNRSEFDVFRARVLYPILHTRSRISCQVNFR